MNHHHFFDNINKTISSLCSYPWFCTLMLIPIFGNKQKNSVLPPQFVINIAMLFFSVEFQQPSDKGLYSP